MDNKDPGAVIYQAIQRGDLESLKASIGNNKERLLMPSPVFGTWLHEAASAGHLPIVKWLIDQQIGINDTDAATLCTALNCASIDGYPDIVKVLLDNRAVVDVSEPERNPLFSAISNGHVEIAKMLIDSGMDFRVKYSGESMNEMDALGFALEYGQAEIADYLRSKGVQDPTKPTRHPQALEFDSIVAFLEERVVVPTRFSCRHILPTDPPISIYAGAVDGAHILVTDGMSSRRMNVPVGQEKYAYAELIMLLPPRWRMTDEGMDDPNYSWPVQWLMRLAQYPHQHNTWLGAPTAVISSANPPVPFAPNTKLSCFLALPGGFELGSCKLSDGREVIFYDLTPIYTEERDLELKYGSARLLELFEQYGIGRVLDVNRVNVATIDE